MSVEMSLDRDRKLAELRVDGRVSRADFDRIAPEFEAFVEECGQIRLLEVIETLGGFDPSLLWDGMKLDLKVIPHISHCAVVSDIGWLSPLSKAAGALISTRLRTFALSEEEAARAWLAEG